MARSIRIISRGNARFFITAGRSSRHRRVELRCPCRRMHFHIRDNAHTDKLTAVRITVTTGCNYARLHRREEGSTRRVADPWSLRSSRRPWRVYRHARGIRNLPRHWPLPVPIRTTTGPRKGLSPAAYMPACFFIPRFLPAPGPKSGLYRRVFRLLQGKGLSISRPMMAFAIPAVAPPFSRMSRIEPFR